MNGLDWVLDEKKKSAANLITAPRIFAYTVLGRAAEHRSPMANRLVHGYNKMQRMVLMELNFLAHHRK
jgi:hypothetical protein